MKLVYVAGPYRAPDYLGIDENIMQARKACAELATSGVGFLSPHQNSAHFEAITPEIPDTFWIDMTLEMLRRADAVYLLPGWEGSKGTLGEVKEAERLGLPIFEPGDLWALVAWSMERQR